MITCQQIAQLRAARSPSGRLDPLEPRLASNDMIFLTLLTKLTRPGAWRDESSVGLEKWLTTLRSVLAHCQPKSKRFCSCVEHFCSDSSLEDKNALYTEPPVKRATRAEYSTRSLIHDWASIPTSVPGRHDHSHVFARSVVSIRPPWSPRKALETVAWLTIGRLCANVIDTDPLWERARVRLMDERRIWSHGSQSMVYIREIISIEVRISQERPLSWRQLV